MEWISVKDRLPETSENVLCFLGDVILMGCLCENGHWAYFFSDNGRQIDDYRTKSLTHWMPLPEPPNT